MKVYLLQLKTRDTNEDGTR